MAKEKAKKSKPADDRQERWEAHLLAIKENNQSVYDTMGGDAQIANLPDSFK